MSNNYKQSTISIILFLVFFLSSVLSCFCFAFGSDFNYLSLLNKNGHSYTRGQCSIKLKDPPNGSYTLKKEGDGEDTIQSCILSTPKTNRILLSTSFKPNEEKTYQITETKKTTPNSIPISTSPGTLYNFVNYDKAYIISCEPDNSVEISTTDNKILESFTLNKVEDKVFHSSTPTNIVVRSKKPVYIFESSLSDDVLSQKESGDSDTTTLFGTHLFFYNPGHIWISSYHPNTKVKILDQNQIPVKSFTVNPDNGIFLSDLKPACYSVITTLPITLQTGFLDNENYSYIFGELNQVNGFSFGDLLFYSPYDDVIIDLSYNDINKTITLKESGTTFIEPTIDNFSPSKPEYSYFTAQSTLPFYILSFSSGNNFGGEFSPGSHGSFHDTEFTMISSRVSKEFSKDQKNLLEIHASDPLTSITLNPYSKENSQHISLNQYSFFDYLSSEPLSKIDVSGDKLISCLQLHNYTSKGLFYYVPPISSTISYSFKKTPSSNGGLFTNENKNPNSLSHFVNPTRWITFSRQITNPSLLPFTAFFGGFLLLFLFLLLWIIFKKQTIIEEKPSEIGDNSIPKIALSNTIAAKDTTSSTISIHENSQNTAQNSCKSLPNNKFSENNHSKPLHTGEELSDTMHNKKRIHIDPEHKPLWMKENNNIDSKNDVQENDKIPSSQKESRKDSSSNNTKDIRKGLRIHTPTFDNSSDLSDLPALNTNQDEIFSSIKKNISHRKKADHVQIISKENNGAQDNLSESNNELNNATNTYPINPQDEKAKIKETYSKSSKSPSQNTNKLIEKVYSSSNLQKSSNKLDILYQSPIVVDPGAANRLYIEGILGRFKKVFMAFSSSKKLSPELRSQLSTIKLNINDKAKAITMKDSCNTFEEAGYAFVVCKKKHIKYYISSYQLPKKINGIEVLSIHDIIKQMHH